MLKAVNHLHKHQILHGDIKLENFMVGQSIDDIKLIDFGHSIKVKDIPNRPVNIFGTVVTVAPEIINR